MQVISPSDESRRGGLAVRAAGCVVYNRSRSCGRRCRRISDHLMSPGRKFS